RSAAVALPRWALRGRPGGAQGAEARRLLSPRSDLDLLSDRRMSSSSGPAEGGGGHLSRGRRPRGRLFGGDGDLAPGRHVLARGGRGRHRTTRGQQAMTVADLTEAYGRIGRVADDVLAGVRQGAAVEDKLDELDRLVRETVPLWQSLMGSVGGPTVREGV